MLIQNGVWRPRKARKLLSDNIHLQCWSKVMPALLRLTHQSFLASSRTGTLPTDMRRSVSVSRWSQSDSVPGQTVWSSKFCWLLLFEILGCTAVVMDGRPRWRRKTVNKGELRLSDVIATHMTTSTSHAELVCARMHHLMILEDIWSVNIIAQVNSSSRQLLLLIQFERVDGLMTHSIDIFMSILVGVRTVLRNLIPWWWIRQSDHTVSGLQWGSKNSLWLHVVKFSRFFFASNVRMYRWVQMLVVWPQYYLIFIHLHWTLCLQTFHYLSPCRLHKHLLWIRPWVS